MSSNWYKYPECKAPEAGQGPIEVMLVNGKHQAFDRAASASWLVIGSEWDIEAYRFLTPLEFAAYGKSSKFGVHQGTGNDVNRPVLWDGAIAGSNGRSAVNRGQNLIDKTEALPPASVDATLAERGKRYGDFSDHARIAQALQDSMRAEGSQNWVRLSSDKKQALTVIADKIARILSGDPEYKDNWHDIQGYAKLAEDRCKESAQ